MMTLGEIESRMKKINAWALEENSIVKDFGFNSFKEAVDFVNKVADLAEKMNHHPTIVISYNTVRISLTTHTENSISKRDFDLAEEIEKI